MGFYKYEAKKANSVKGIYIVFTRKKIKDRYIMKKKLSEGGMSRVYLIEEEIEIINRGG